MPVVDIYMYAGRSKEQKSEMVRRISKDFEEVLSVKPESLNVLFHDVEKSDWGIRGISPRRRRRSKSLEPPSVETGDSMPVKIGFIGSSAPSSPHHDSFRRFIPEDLEFTFVQEASVKTSLYDARGKVDALIGQVQELITERDWDGVIHGSGAPKEALNPGMWERVSGGFKVPISLALRSSVAALKAFAAKTHSPDDPGG